MKILNRIKTENVVSIDIETVRLFDKYEDADESTQDAWEYKNKNEGIIPDHEELSRRWLQSSALYAEFSKICAVSITFMHKGTLFAKEFYGPDEESILQNVGETLDSIENTGSEYRLAGHSAKFFDYPYLCKRFIINGLEIPSIIDTTDKKPWEQTNLDTNELWKMGGSGHGSSLTALCNALQIPTSKVDMTGDQVGDEYYKKEYEKIGRYCSFDTIVTFNVLRKFKQESVFDFEDVVYINGITTKAEKVETNPFEELFKTDYLSDSIKADIQKRLGKKKLTKKDKEFLEEILVTAYVRTEFLASDKPDVVEAKVAEVRDFVKNL